MATLARARAMEETGRSIIHMEAGEPDFPTPPPILAAALESLRGGFTRYTQSAGLPELRMAIARDYARCHGVDIDPARVIVTPGATGALELALMCCTDVGDRVLIADPGYPCHRQVSRLIGLDPVGVRCESQAGFRWSAHALEQAGPAKAVVFASPSNPTGAVASEEDLQGAIRLARLWAGRLIVDELYLELSYGRKLKSVAALADDAFIVNGFSKYHGMTGWRLGWAVVPSDCAAAAERLAENLFLAPSTPAQYGALAAFSGECMPVLEERVHALCERRDFLVPELRGLGFSVPVTPEGAFYVYADCSAFAKDSLEFSARLLDEAGVAMAPGCDFGQYHAERYVRFAYTTSLDNLREGVRRMREWLSRARKP